MFSMVTTTENCTGPLYKKLTEVIISVMVRGQGHGGHRNRMEDGD